MASARAASMSRPMSLSKRMPGGGANWPGPCNLPQIREVARRIAERFGFHAHALHQAEMKIAERRLAAVDDAPARVQAPAAPADDHRGQVRGDMPVAVVEAGAVDNHHVVKQPAVVFLQYREPFDPRR